MRYSLDPREQYKITMEIEDAGLGAWRDLPLPHTQRRLSLADRREPRLLSGCPLPDRLAVATRTTPRSAPSGSRTSGSRKSRSRSTAEDTAMTGKPSYRLPAPAVRRATRSSERFCAECGMPLTYAGKVDVEESATGSRERARKVNPEYTRGDLRRVATARQQPEAELIQMLLLEEGVPSTVRRVGRLRRARFARRGPARRARPRVRARGRARDPAAERDHRRGADRAAGHVDRPRPPGRAAAARPPARLFAAGLVSGSCCRSTTDRRRLAFPAAISQRAVASGVTSARGEAMRSRWARQSVARSAFEASNADWSARAGSCAPADGRAAGRPLGPCSRASRSKSAPATSGESRGEGGNRTTPRAGGSRSPAAAAAPGPRSTGRRLRAATAPAAARRDVRGRSGGGRTGLFSPRPASCRARSGVSMSASSESGTAARRPQALRREHVDLARREPAGHVAARRR